MRVLFLCEGTTVPATRFRVGQLVPHFERAGIECSVRYSYGERYNAIARTRFSSPYRLAMRLKRVALSADAGAFDIVFSQRPTLPQSALPELALKLLNPRTIFDYDDAIWLGAGGAASSHRAQTFARIARSSAHLIAGNDFLASRANQPAKTSTIPTVIDTDKYAPSDARENSPVVIGWMGTAGNFPSLEQLVPCLTRILGRHPEVILRVVSNAEFRPLLGHPQVEQLPWSADLELQHLRSFSVGLMPLVDSEINRGKCAFKMITYMAVETPVVVSAVGANMEVLEGVSAGFLQTSFDWDHVLSQLIRDTELRRAMGKAGRQRVIQKYSIDAVLPRYLEIFESVAN